MRPNREVVLEEVVLLEDVLRAPTLKAYFYSLHTY